MLKYLLDTNICIYLMKKQPKAVVRRFARCAPGEVALSSITWAELCYGLETHDGEDRMAALFKSLVPVEFGMDAAAVYGRLSRQFPNRKGSFDRMIAAHAMTLEVTLVTNNLADFAAYRPAGLMLENWTAPE